LRQNASILEQGCAGFSPGSANRCDQFGRHFGRTSSPLRPSLSFRYIQEFDAGPASYRVVIEAAPDTIITAATTDFDIVVRFVTPTDRLSDAIILETAS
jgi:hypothetical protein